jgi:hypothetical protein
VIGLTDEKQIDLKLWKGLDWYYEYSEAGFSLLPGSTVILTVGIVIGLIAFSLLMVPCFIIGMMFGGKQIREMRESRGTIGPVFNHDR